MANKYNWNFASVGGNTRVNIATGEDIRHLGELDQKMWTILSCPTTGLEIPDETLKLMDFDNDGKIRVNEVVKTSEWLCSVLKDPQVLIEETGILRVADIADEAIAEVAGKLADEAGNVSVEAVKEAIATAAGTVAPAEVKAAPACPVDGGIYAAFNANKEAFNAHFEAVRLEKLGLAKVDAENAPAIAQKDWDELAAKIAAYEAELAAVNAENQAAADAVTAAQAAATAQYQPLLKLMLLKRDFFTLLKNYITLTDFYSRDKKAIFQCGTLIIDQRACDLCVRVADAGAMGAQAAASGMYLLFCDCVNKASGKTMSIVAAMTVGDIKNLAVGKNAIFYDRNGLDYDAKVTKILDNPISIKQAFWSPYRKFANWVMELINKSAAEKESKGFEDMKANATKATEDAKAKAEGGAAAPAPAFDIAKFAGIFAAIGMALGMIGTALAAVFSGLADLKWWQLILVFVAILLCISGPSMFIAWMKLRRRNLAPVLNANGWAVNAEAIVNVKFGTTLCQNANFPMLKLDDPFSDKMPAWKKALYWCLGIVLACGLCLFVAHKYFGFCPCGCCQAEAVEEPAVEAVEEAPAEEVAAEVAPQEEVAE